MFLLISVMFVNAHQIFTVVHICMKTLHWLPYFIFNILYFQLHWNSFNTKEQQWWDKCDNQKIKYTVESFKVIGGYYGATTELEMMKEILTQGPITGMINAPGYVDRYKSGILHSIMPINGDDYTVIPLASSLSNKLSKLLHNCTKSKIFIRVLLYKNSKT